MIIEKRSFFSGMNGDDSPRLLDDKSCLNIMNARMAISEDGRMGRLENIAGTTLIPNSMLPSPSYGTNQTIGSCVDTARSRIIYFVHNSMSNHGIYCYDYLNSVVYAVLYDSQVTGGLGFSRSSRIDRNAKVVGNLLYWTDNLNPPRRINIEAGIKLNQSSYSTTVTEYTSPMTQSVINLIRRPFGLALTAAKAVDGTFTQNFLLNFAGEFASRFLYRDGEYSVTSVPSNYINYNLSTDTYNAVNVTFPLTETFDQDVQIVQLAVRYGNDPSYFVIKEWNKANTVDAAAIAAHNAGSTALTFRFYNNKIGTPISDADSVKPEDNIGLTVKTLEVADNRLFLANYTKGYNTPTTTSIFGTLQNAGPTPSTTSVWKSYSTYQLGVRFRDLSGRKSFIVTSNSSIVNVGDRDYAFTTVPTLLTWFLSNTDALNEIPDWAYYYDIVITKNLRTRFFVQDYSGDLQYVKKDQNGVFTYQSTYDASVYGIGINLSTLNVKGAGYVFNEGDLARLYLGNTSTVYELNVIAQDGNYAIVKPENLGNLNPQPGCYFEIYTPYKRLDNEAFYTVGQSYTITNPTTALRQYSTLTANITGDVTRFYVAFNFIFGTITIIWEAMSPSYNNWKDWFQIYGQSNFQSLLGQVSKTNFVSWSNVKIIGAQTNGLSTFDALDEKALPPEIGVNKLQLTNKLSDMGQGNIMLAIGDTETASLYLSERQLMDAAKQGNIAISTEVIGSVNVLKGSRGTTHPETVIPIWGLVFWYDILNGVFVQYAVNGLTDVSEYKMSRYFKSYAKNYLALNNNNLDNINGFHHIPTGVDPFSKQILCGCPALIYENYANTLPSFSSVPSYATSIINRFDISDSLAKTMVFSINENKWDDNVEYGNEWFESLDNQMFGWKDGKLYSFNTDTTNYNTFFGTQRPVRICLTANLNPSLLKNLANLCVESNVVPNFSVAYSDYPNVQITDLSSADNVWRNQEGQFFATWLADRLSPNASGTADQKLYTGDPITGIVIQVMLEFQAYSSLFYCNFVDIGYEAARGQKAIANPING